MGSSFAVQARKNTFGENFVFFICNLKQLDNCLSTLAGVGLREFGTKRFQFLKILIIKPLKSIIKCEKRTKQNSDYQKTSFVRFLYLRSDFCPSLHSLFWFLGEKIAKKQEEQKNVSSDKMNFRSFI